MSHLRRQDRAITDPTEIEAILVSGKYATCGLVDGDEPYVVTLSYGYDADAGRLCFHVAPEGRKLDLIASNPRACVSVVRDMGYTAGACEHPFESVVMTGRMRLLDDRAEQRAAMATLIEHLEGADNAAIVSARNKLDTDAPFMRMGVLVFEIEQISAKRGK